MCIRDRGYYKMPEATAAAIDQDGWLHTGDLARRTPEGNFKITGRIKDMIIRGGEPVPGGAGKAALPAQPSGQHGTCGACLLYTSKF